MSRGLEWVSRKGWQGLCSRAMNFNVYLRNSHRRWVLRSWSAFSPLSLQAPSLGSNENTLLLSVPLGGLRRRLYLELYFYLRKSRRLEERMQIMLTDKHMKGSTSRQEEETAPDSTGSLPSSALVKSPHLWTCCLPIPAGLLDPQGEWHQHHLFPAAFIYLLNTPSQLWGHYLLLAAYNQVQLSQWSELLCFQWLFLSLEMNFCYSIALSMFDLMGWGFLALLCDYTLGILLIMS